MEMYTVNASIARHFKDVAKWQASLSGNGLHFRLYVLFLAPLIIMMMTE